MVKMKIIILSLITILMTLTFANAKPTKTTNLVCTNEWDINVKVTPEAIWIDGEYFKFDHSSKDWYKPNHGAVAFDLGDQYTAIGRYGDVVRWFTIDKFQLYLRVEKSVDNYKSIYYKCKKVRDIF